VGVPAFTQLLAVDQGWPAGKGNSAGRDNGRIHLRERPITPDC